MRKNSRRRLKMAATDRRRVRALRAVALAIGLASRPMCAHAETPFNDIRTSYGELGILEMPSSRMAPDGQIGVTVALVGGNRRVSGTFQLLPWLEGSFRYAFVPKFLNLDHYYDRSFGLKARLFRETDYTPELSVGLRDILGSGIYSGEYLVASKQWSDFDVTLGVGWGRLAQRGTFANPLRLVFPSFEQRQSFLTAGLLDVGQLFHGRNVGVFGGVIWHTPIENLNLLLEYSSDKYNDERVYRGFVVRSPINVGLSYNVYDTVVLSAGYLYGTTYGATLSMSVDPTTDISVAHYGPALPDISVRSPEQQVNAMTSLIQGASVRNTPSPQRAWVNLSGGPIAPELAVNSALQNFAVGVRDVELQQTTLIIDTSASSLNDACALYGKIAGQVDESIKTVAVSNLSNSPDVAICQVPPRAGERAGGQGEQLASPLQVDGQIRAAIAAQGISVEALSIRESNLWLYFTNEQYRNLAEAARRISRVLTKLAPTNVEIFHIVDVTNGQPDREFTIARSAIERAFISGGSETERGGGVLTSLPPLDNPLLDRQASYPRFDWSIGPGFRESAFDPRNPLQVQILAALDGTLHLTRNLDLSARIEANIYNNFNLTASSDSLLPHVRSDAVEYYRKGINGVASLYASYRTRLAPDTFAELKVGYLESMFAGVGGQILWQPDNQRVTFGADLYQVWQRSFDRLYGVRPYNVLTGHVAMYYASPWYGLNFNVYAGRYLAGDYGATFEIARRFSTGVEIAAFATFTNVPFSKFGEGSFDKGIEVRIPFEWGLPFYSHSDYSLTLRSLTRDGGQRLDGDNSLYSELRSASYGEVVGHIEDVTAP